MAKVKITGHASGTGILTVTAPNTSTDRTITLPDATGTLLTEVADNAITLAKMASGTDGNIISYDASGNPVAIATGSDGQVLTSTGAGSPPAFEAAAAGGKINQYVSTVLTANDQSSTTTGSWIDVTGLSRTITPSATNSVIVIHVDLVCAINDGDHMHMRVQRDINSGGYGDWNYNVGVTGDSVRKAMGAGGTKLVSNDQTTSWMGGTLIDSTHNSTAVVTYKVQFYLAGGTFTVNRSNNATTGNSAARSISTITCMEVTA